jgi:hypothetical protein
VVKGGVFLLSEGTIGVIGVDFDSDSGSGSTRPFLTRKFWKVEREESLRLTEAGEMPVEIRYCL